MGIIHGGGVKIKRKIGRVKRGALHTRLRRRAERIDKRSGSGYNHTAQSDKTGRYDMIKGLSHIAVRARDLEASLRFYREILGLEEAFRITEEDGRVRLLYLWIAPGQFIEIFPGGTTDPERGSHMTGMQHICLEVDSVEAAYDRLCALGVKPDSEITTGKAGGRQFWLHDPDGNPIELMELGPESMHAQAAERFARKGQDRD